MTFKDLLHIAFAIIERMPPGIHMVSGPISTGGVGTIEGNRRVFEGVIDMLILEKRFNVFSQMPFEDKIVELYLQWHADNPKEKYCTPILTDLYEPIFTSGRVKVLHFIPGWESSTGARWEHESCGRWAIERRYLPTELPQQIMATA